jgi:hypothetical protein
MALACFGVFVVMTIRTGATLFGDVVPAEAIDTRKLVLIAGVRMDSPPHTVFYSSGSYPQARFMDSVKSLMRETDCTFDEIASGIEIKDTSDPGTGVEFRVVSQAEFLDHDLTRGSKLQPGQSAVHIAKPFVCGDTMAVCYRVVRKGHVNDVVYKYTRIFRLPGWERGGMTVLTVYPEDKGAE